jgi:hypothetical protein
MSYSLGLTPAQANLDMGWTPAKVKAYWDAKAKACQQYGDEGECLAQVAKHVPVTIGGLGYILPPFPPIRTFDRPGARTYGRRPGPKRRPKRRRPLRRRPPRRRLGGLGLGTTGTDIASILTVTGGLFSDPDGTLRRYGPPIVTAADKHVVTPLMQRFGKATAPYLVKYLLPPMAVLYVLTGISAYYSYRSARKLAANPSRRRRRGKRRKRRTSRRR